MRRPIGAGLKVSGLLEDRPRLKAWPIGLPRFIAFTTLVGFGLESSGHGEIAADYNSAPSYHQRLTYICSYGGYDGPRYPPEF